jgi:hypothetical protein
VPRIAGPIPTTYAAKDVRALLATALQLAGCMAFRRHGRLQCLLETSGDIHWADSITCCITSAPPPFVLSQSSVDSTTFETESHSPSSAGQADALRPDTHAVPVSQWKHRVSRAMSKARRTLNLRASNVPTLGSCG